MHFDKAQFPEKYTLGVVYPAKEVDAHGDTMSVQELQKAAWKALGRNVQVGLMHRPGTAGSGKVVESYIWRGKKQVMKDVNGNEQIVEPGDWLMGCVWGNVAWQAIMSGTITGYSLQGVAKKDYEWDMSSKSAEGSEPQPSHVAIVA